MSFKKHIEKRLNTEEGRHDGYFLTSDIKWLICRLDEYLATTTTEYKQPVEMVLRFKDKEVKSFYGVDPNEPELNVAQIKVIQDNFNAVCKGG